MCVTTTFQAVEFSSLLIASHKEILTHRALSFAPVNSAMASHHLQLNGKWSNQDALNCPVHTQLFSYFNNFLVMIITLIVDWKYIKSCIK